MDKTVDKRILLDALDQVPTYLPRLLGEPERWVAFEQDSIVRLEGIACPFKISDHAVIVCFTRFLAKGMRCPARRYCAPFAVRVLSGSYGMRWSQSRADEVLDLGDEARLLPEETYACTAPGIWQGIRMFSDTADNLVIVGRRYKPRVRPKTGIYFPFNRLRGQRVAELCEQFRSSLLRTLAPRTIG